ncbi:MAG: ATP-binding cassette domain-containing protein [Treponema sp.]|jgi:branched-chain amino acid transport system ATP-binding protein|nr:ATP-binding cassette domain-containing protein [Treponema sp.]
MNSTTRLSRPRFGERLKEQYYFFIRQIDETRVERLGIRAGMIEQYMPIRRERLNSGIEKKLALFDYAAEKELSALQDKFLPAEELFKKKYAQKEDALNKQYRLKFREYRQKLRRAEGVVDADNNLPGELAPESAKKVEVYEAELEAEKKRIIQKAADQFIKKETSGDRDGAEARSRWEERKKELAEERDRLKKGLEAKADAEYRIFAEHNEKRIARIKEKLNAERRKSEAVTTKSHTLVLPEDVALRLDGLCMYFGGLKAVDGLSFDVKKGEIFGLIGPNGSGKTTVFNCITQFYKPTSGEIWFNDRYGTTLRLNKYAVHNIIKTGIVRTFQNIELVAELTVLDNLLIAAHTQYHSGFISHMFFTPTLKRETEVLTPKALGILEEMKLLHLKDAYPVGMPYGVLKRIELARTLMADASLIILDEPAAGLNEKETEELTELLKQISREYEVTIFLVEHDMGLVMDICNHICAISFGKKLAYGVPKEIQESKDVQEAYLGVE